MNIKRIGEYKWSIATKSEVHERDFTDLVER